MLHHINAVVLRNVNSAPPSSGIGSSSKSGAGTRQRQTGNNGTTHKIDRNMDANDPFSVLSEAVSEQHHSEISVSLGRSNGSLILPHSGEVVPPSSVSPPRMSIIKNLKALSPRHGGSAQVHNLVVVDVTGTSCHAQQADATATATADYTADTSYDAKAHLLLSGSNGEITISDDNKFSQLDSNNMELGVR
jgi:hypothetical protein